MPVLHRLKSLLLLLSLLGVCHTPQCQEMTAGRVLDSPGQLDNLVQGRLYSPNYFPIKGNPFLTDNWSRENIRYQGRSYSNIPVWYDIYLDDLILLNQRGAQTYFVRLNKAYMETFTLADRSFIHLRYSRFADSGLAGGYYELCFEDKLVLLARRVLVVKEEKETLTPYFSREDRRFIITGEEVVPVEGRRSLLAIVGKMNRRLLKSFIKQQDIRLRSASDSDWVQLAEFMNGLQTDSL